MLDVMGFFILGGFTFDTSDCARDDSLWRLGKAHIIICNKIAHMKKFVSPGAVGCTMSLS